jgi:hypothetical protein
MKEAGATAFVAATAIFKHPQGAKAGVESLRAVLNHGDTESWRL